ncbi:MAG TPA: hypothetical protein VH417_12925 [Vicinamibacterales bacterium]|jgi:hypothetical protein
MALHISEQFWTFGALRCIFVFTDPPTSLYVQVVCGKKTIYVQRVIDPVDAAQTAEDLWKMFVETPA